MNYTVELTRRAERQLLALPQSISQRVVATLLALENEPRPHGCVKLRGWTNEYRVRVGDYRTVYKVDDTPRTV